MTSFPSFRTQILEGPPRTSETPPYPTLLVTAAIFHFPTIDTRPTSLGNLARNRITKIHLFHIANLFRTTYCGANLVGRTDSPHIQPTENTRWMGPHCRASNLTRGRIVKKAGKKSGAEQWWVIYNSWDHLESNEITPTLGKISPPPKLGGPHRRAPRLSWGATSPTELDN